MLRVLIALFTLASQVGAARLALRANNLDLGAVEDPVKYASCLENAKTWLPDSGVGLCKVGQYEQAEAQVACVKTAYHPFYDRSGLDWAKDKSTAKALEVCKQNNMDKDVSLNQAKCLFEAWDLGEDARSGCSVKSSVLNYTSCLSDGKGWLPEGGTVVCKAGKYEQAKTEVACVKTAYHPFYDRSGLDWVKNRSTSKALDVCKQNDLDKDASLKQAKCLVAAWDLGEDARSGCSPSVTPTVAPTSPAPVDPEAKRKAVVEACVVDVQKMMPRSISAKDLEILCIKTRFSDQSAVAIARCLGEHVSNSTYNGSQFALSMGGVVDIVQCMEKAWRNITGCGADLFAPVGDVKGVVFVVDISGSMSERIPGQKQLTREKLMKTELKKAVESLNANQSFQVLAFNTAVTDLLSGGDLIPATVENKKRLESWLQRVDVGGGTDIGKALSAALVFDGVQSVHLLSDGLPNNGCTRASCMFASGNADWHGGKMVPIHTTLLIPGTSSEKVEARRLLQNISDMTGGSFREPF